MPISPIRTVSSKVWGLSHDGVDDYDEAPLDMAILIANKAFTVEAWVYWRAISAWAKLVSTDYHQTGAWASPYTFFALSQRADLGTWQVFFPTVRKTDDTLLTDTSSTGVPVKLNEWTHVVGRTWIEDTTVYNELWLDGELAWSTSVEDVKNYDPGAADRIFVGVRSSFAPGEYGNFILATLRIYNRKLSDSEISDNMNGYVVTDGLLLWLWANELLASGNVWRDRSGYGNHATIYGAVWTETPRIEFAKPTRLIAQTRLISPTR